MPARILLLLVFPVFLKAQPHFSNRIDSLLGLHKDFSGVVLIASNGKPIYYKAVGYREFAKNIPLLKTDVFELASVSKQFTAAIIMMLKDSGKLGYDDNVEQYLEIPYKGITVRQLLTHTSGLPDYQEIMDKYWDKTKIASNKEILEYLNRYAPPKLFEPGEKYEYSNTGYVLLASIAEKVSEVDFIDLCQRWIFTPLQMNSTGIRTLQQKAAVTNFAIGHVYVPEKQQYVRADSFPSSDYTIWLGNRKGPGRISATAMDLLKWDQALYKAKLIKAVSLKEAFEPGKLKNGQQIPYGFGWMLPGDNGMGKTVMHTGDNPGYKTQITRYINRKQTILLLCNNYHPQFEAIAAGIEAILQTPVNSKRKPDNK
jgi:CubicO group peptidase (beta-lactamase class C family)